MHIIGQGKFYSKLRNFQIYDVNEEPVGHVGDLLLRKKDLSVYAIISHDGIIREKLEALHIIDDHDEIIPLHRVNKEKQLPNQIHTTIRKSKLPSTSSKWSVPEDYYLFSELCKATVYDKDGDSIGRITDIIYHEDEQFSIVVDPASYIQHFLEIMHLRHHHEIIIPGDFIVSIEDDEITLSMDRVSIEKIDALPIHNILQKPQSDYSNQPESPKKRYHYYVLQAPLNTCRDQLEHKGGKFDNARDMLEIRAFNEEDSNQVNDFVSLFNEVALTSVDPYEQLDSEKVKHHFKNGSYLAYFLNKPVGYCITTREEEGSIGVIAGIGIHHKHRGKRFSSALMADIIDRFSKEGVQQVQCDVLQNNQASLGLFHGLGFEQIDDFYLS